MDRKKTSRERADLGEEVDVLGLKKIWQDGITPRPEHELDPRVPGLSEFCGPPQCLGRPFDELELQACHHGVSGNQAPCCTFCPRRSCNTL